MSRDEDKNQIVEKLKELTNAANQPLLNLNQTQELSVQLVPDRSVSPGKFKPSTISPGSYLAHPVTIRALKKDIFAVGNELFEDLEDIIQCTSCKSQVDRQFWHFCPYCEESFPHS